MTLIIPYSKLRLPYVMGTAMPCFLSFILQLMKEFGFATLWSED
jgi:hypothetical protein